MLICRPHYELLLERHRGSSLIKVLVGVRRCGKSSLLRLFADGLVRGGASEKNIVHVKLDEYGMPLDPTADWLALHVGEALSQADPNEPAYVLLDEVQDVSGWERVVRQLHARERTEVYLTGSNAYLLSAELATLLSGRYIEIPVFPLSFGEYLAFEEAMDGTAPSHDEAFGRYLRFGGMPGQFGLAERTPDTMLDLLRGVFDSVILKDVAQRVRVSDLDLLNKLVRYLFSTSGTLFSTKKIVDTLTSMGRSASFGTIESYLDALCNALVLRSAPQFGLAGKKALNPKRKFYPADTGLRNLAARFSPSDAGFQLENVVFNELIKRGFHVSVGTVRSGEEIDFVAEATTGEREYYQVTQSLLDEATYDRELKPFSRLSDGFPKTVLTLDRVHAGLTEEGIRIKHVIDWLLEAEDYAENYVELCAE